MKLVTMQKTVAAGIPELSPTGWGDVVVGHSPSTTPGSAITEISKGFNINAEPGIFLISSFLVASLVQHAKKTAIIWHPGRIQR